MGVLSSRNKEKALRHRTNSCLRAGTLGTSLVLLAAMPSIVIASGMGWQGQVPITVLLYVLEMWSAWKLALHLGDQQAGEELSNDESPSTTPKMSPNGTKTELGISMVGMGNIGQSPPLVVANPAAT